MSKKYNEMTKHEKHAYLVDKVRREYQQRNPNSRLFKNTSGMAWQGEISNHSGHIQVLHPRPIRFGIPEPKPGEDDGSGGADLLGETAYCEMKDENCSGCKKLPCPHMIPIITGIEVKTGKSKLKKNQKIFRDWLLRISALHFVGRECPNCNGVIGNKVCPECLDDQYILEES